MRENATYPWVCQKIRAKDGLEGVRLDHKCLLIAVFALEIQSEDGRSFAKDCFTVAYFDGDDVRLFNGAFADKTF